MPSRPLRSSLCLLVLAVGCATTPASVSTREQPATEALKSPAADAPPPIGLRFDVTPADAQIDINGESKGTVAALAGSGGVIALPRGFYRLTLKAPGHETWRAEVEVADKLELIQLTMVKLP